MSNSKRSTIKTNRYTLTAIRYKLAVVGLGYVGFPLALEFGKITHTIGFDLNTKRLSLQRHRNRSEHWVVVQGEAKITNGRNILFLEENQSTYIPKKGIHRLENATNKPLKIIEVQCGKELLESDIQRLDDDHGRI